MLTYLVVTVYVNGVKCRALLDTGAGSSYASSALLDLIKAKPTRNEFKRIEMMLGTVNLNFCDCCDSLLYVGSISDRFEPPSPKAVGKHES